MLFLPWDLVIPYPELKWYNIVGTFRGKIYKIKDLQKIMAKKILIIEDDNFLRILLSKKLRSEVYSILSAAEAVEAFNLLKSNKPDLILLDLLLPGVDGFEILKKIRQTEETKNIPVIVFSNLSEEKENIKETKLFPEPISFKKLIGPSFVILTLGLGDTLSGIKMV